MKPLIIFLILLNTAFSQITYNGDKAIIDTAYWQKIKVKLINLHYENESKDSIILIQDIAINKLNKSILHYETSLKTDSLILNLSKKNSSEKPDILEWQGLYFGLQCYYTFGSEYLKFTDGLKFGIFLNARLRVESYSLEPEFILPFNGQSEIKLKLGKRIF